MDNRLIDIQYIHHNPDPPINGAFSFRELERQQLTYALSHEDDIIDLCLSGHIKVHRYSQYQFKWLFKDVE